MGLVAFLFGVLQQPTVAGPVLRRLLGDLGVSDDAGRALLARMVRQGQLSSERDGRTTRYRLAGEFARAFERVRDRPRARSTTWSGEFHALLYHVPERHRDFRDAVRRAALFAGYGILQQGVLIALSDRRTALGSTLDNPPPGTRMWLTTMAMPADAAAEAASIAWDLPGLATLYREHIGRLGSHLSAATSGSQALRTYATVLQPALTDTLREPALPGRLLPADWPGPSLRQAVDTFNAAHFPAVADYVRALTG